MSINSVTIQASELAKLREALTVSEALLTDARAQLDSAKAAQIHTQLGEGRECLHCGKDYPIAEMYRCFECKSWLCETHIKAHLGDGYVPHPKLRDQFIVELQELRQRATAAEAENSELHKTLDTNSTQMLVARMRKAEAAAAAFAEQARQPLEDTP